MKKAILTTLAVMIMASASHADDFAVGCKATSDKRAGTSICSGTANNPIAYLNCKNTFLSTGDQMLTQKYGSASTQTSNMFAGITSTWTHVSDSWYFDLLPNLSQEDADVLYYLFLQDSTYSFLRGKMAEDGLTVTAPLYVLNGYYKPGHLNMLPRAKRFYKAFFEGDVTAIREQIEVERAHWKADKVNIDNYCRKQGVQL